MRRYWMAVWWVTVWAGLCATGCFSTPESDFFDRLSDAVEALRDSPNPGDREMYSAMKLAAHEKKIAKQFSDLHENDPVAMVLCRKDAGSPEDDDLPEATEPEIPKQLSNFPTRYRVSDLVHCMATASVRPALGNGFWLMKYCVKKALEDVAKLHQDYLRTSGFNDAICKVHYMPGFKNPADRTWEERSSISTEEIVMMLLGLQKPIAGVSLKWFTTNMVEPFPGCGLCRPQTGGDR